MDFLGPRTVGLYALLTAATSATAQNQGDLAKQLSNPVASLISVPFQFNWDDRIGPARDGDRLTMNFQPVIPISLNAEWNLISRTIVPVIDQDLPSAGGSRSGLGDTVQSLFLSPKAPTAGGVIWGAGPVFLLPTGRSGLSAERWGLGPTGVVLRQNGPHTVGALANHIWSVGGSSNPDVNSTFLQPFYSYATPTGTSFTLNTESTYDWEARQWNAPVGAFVAQIFKLGGQVMQASVGARYYVESPESGPHGWGFRATFVLLYPR